MKTKLWDIEVELKDKPFVIGYDSFGHEHWFEDYFDDIEKAENYAKSKSGDMTLMYVFNKDGEQVGGKYGKF